MAAFNAGCTHTLKAHWDAYALVKGRESYEKGFTPLSFPLPSLPPSLPYPLIHTSFLMSLLSSAYHDQLWFSSPLNTNFKLFYSAA